MSIKEIVFKILEEEVKKDLIEKGPIHAIRNLREKFPKSEKDEDGYHSSKISLVEAKRFVDEVRESLTLVWTITIDAPAVYNGFYVDFKNFMSIHYPKLNYTLKETLKE